MKFRGALITGLVWLSLIQGSQAGHAPQPYVPAACGGDDCQDSLLRIAQAEALDLMTIRTILAGLDQVRLRCVSLAGQGGAAPRNVSRLAQPLNPNSGTRCHERPHRPFD